MRVLFKTLFFLFVIQSTFSYACQCKSLRSVTEEIDRSDAVLVGRIISKESFQIEADPNKLRNIDNYSRDKTFSGIKYQLKVFKSYKGKIKEDIVTIYSSNYSGNCGYIFEVDEIYIVYGYKYNYYMTNEDIYTFPENHPIFWTNRCMRTRKSDNDEIAEINKALN